MSLFTTSMPIRTGDLAADTEALYAWACSLVGELRSVLYALDTQNVLEARAVKAAGINGVLNENQIPEIDISKLRGDRGYIKLDEGEENGAVFRVTSSNGTATDAARIYYKNSNSGAGLYIEALSGGIHIKAPAIHLNGNVVSQGG